MVSKRARSSNNGIRYFRFYHAMADTPAWASLTCAQRCVYLALAMRFNGHNNGAIGISVRAAAVEANCNKDTATKALNILCERGFIQRTQEGAFTYKVRHSALYRLTHLPVEHGNHQMPATFEFRSWRPGKKIGPN